VLGSQALTKGWPDLALSALFDCECPFQLSPILRGPWVRLSSTHGGVASLRARAVGVVLAIAESTSAAFACTSDGFCKNHTLSTPASPSLEVMSYNNHILRSGYAS